MLGETFLKKGFPPDPLPKTFGCRAGSRHGSAVTAKKFLKGGVGGNSFQRVSLPPSLLENASNSGCDAVHAQFLNHQNHSKDHNI